jgi:competence protein ComEA
MKASGDRGDLRLESEGPAPAAEAEKWVVYVTGEVNRPGIIKIAPDSRLYQAVEAAGGLTAKADREGVNLAEKLSDGAHAHIPNLGERSERDETKTVPSGGERIMPEGSGGIDINHASAAEIDKLPGIGPTLAQEIINDRTANGPFKKAEDLLRVKGIGPAKLEKMKGMILIRP